MIEYNKNLSLENLFYIAEDGRILEEEWMDIPNFEGHYMISNLSRIKSLNRIITFIDGRKNTKKEKIRPQFLNTSGYWSIMLHLKSKHYNFRIHKLMADIFLKFPCENKKLVINHKNFIRTDNRIENLEIVTQRENSNKKHIKSSSIYTGVCWDSRKKRWRAQIFINKQRIFLGYFKNEYDAHLAYQKRLKLHESAN